MKSVKYVAIAIICLVLSSCTKTVITKYPDGAVQSTIHYKFGKENGKSVYFFQHPNTVEIEVEMKNGKRHGEFFRYFVNGNLDTHCTYVKDSIEGKEVIYTPNGELSEENTYVRGKKNGPHKVYHVTGELQIEGNYKDGMFDGDWTYYDDRGIVVGEGKFDAGTGDVISFDKNGVKNRSTHYVNNKKDGKEIYFTPDGKVYKEIIYKQDRITSQSVDSTLIP